MKSSVTYKRIWAISYPIIIGSIAQNVLNVTDTAFLGRLGEIGLGGGAIGGLFYMAMVMLGWGFGVGTQIVVARRYGEGVFRPIGRTIEHGFIFLFILALLIFGFVKIFGDQMIYSMLDSKSIVETSQQFIDFRIWGIFFAHTNFLFRAFYVGIGRTPVITFTTVVMVVVNVILDYALIFGKLGFPEMGVSGAALASVIAEISSVIAFVVFTLYRIPIKKYRLFSFKIFSLKLMTRILKVSIPMMLQNFFAFGVWFVFFLLIEKMGESELAISNIIRSVYVILLIPIMGFSSATSSLVSYVIGQGKQNEVMLTIGKVLVLSGIGVVLVTGIILIIPEQVLSIYTNDPHLIEMGIPLIHVISISSALICIGFIFFSGVSGTGKTNVSLAIEIITLLIYILFTAIIVGVIKGTIVQVWYVEVIYGVLLTTLSYLYLKSKRWIGESV